MTKMPVSSDDNSARAFFLILWGGLCAMIVAAPLLVASGNPLCAAIIYLFFSPVCHQQPERSFVLMGYTLAVCHRCFGIYAGLWAGCIIPLPAHVIVRSPSWRRATVLAGAAPLMLDALLPVTGLWIGTPSSRFFTGLLFGITTSALLIPGLAEIFNGLSPLRLLLRQTNAKGGIS
jgi:uncharacterized membrane protein